MPFGLKRSVEDAFSFRNTTFVCKLDGFLSAELATTFRKVSRFSTAIDWFAKKSLPNLTKKESKYNFKIVYFITMI